VEERELGATGERVSVLGFGAGPLGDEYGRLDESETTGLVQAAIEAGITFFDTAPYYGRTLSEERLGRGLEGRRDEIFLATKCCRYDYRGFDFSAARVHASIDESLARLRTDRVDLFQVHDIEFERREVILAETLPALREVQSSGKARFIGITGLPVRMLREVAAAFPVDTILTYCHGNLLDDELERELAPFAAANGVGLINASPLCMGMLSGDGPRDWHPAPDELKQAGADVRALCAERGTDVTTVALRFALDLQGVATTLVGVKTTAQLEHDLQALASEADTELLAAIAARVARIEARTWHDGLAENAP